MPRRSLAALVALALLLPGALVGLARPAAQLAGAAELTDLAAAAVSPTEAGEGYTWLRGAYRTDPAAPGAIGGDPGDLGVYGGLYADNSARQTYFHHLQLPSDDDPDLVARRIMAVLAEFADADGAAAAFADLNELVLADGYVPTRSVPEIGDEAATLRGEFAAEGGDTYDELRLLVRAGPFFVDLMLLDYEGDAPSATEIVGLGEAVVERLAGGSEAGARLGLAVARTGGEAVTTWYDYATRRDGDQLPTAGARPGQLDDADAYYDEWGVTDAYHYVATIEREEWVAHAVDLFATADDEAAAAFLAQTIGWWTETPPAGYADVEPVADAAPLGDESATFAYERELADGTEAAGYVTWMRAGGRVAAVTLEAAAGVPPEAAAALAAAGAACLAEAGCAGLLPMPGEGGENGGENGEEEGRLPPQEPIYAMP